MFLDSFMFFDEYMMEELMLGLVPAMISGVPSFLFSIAAWVMTSMSLYAMAKRRGIGGAWLSWVPVLNLWVWGSLSDQYRYVVKGQYKSKRKALLILKILQMVMSLAVIVLLVFLAVEVADSSVFGMNEDAWLDMLAVPALIALGLTLPMAGIGIALLVIRYMALYDVYASMDPGNSVLFLVLSIFFSVTEPFFLVFNRHKDEGMPPRRREPAYIQGQQSPWQSGGEASTPEMDRNYL